MSPESAKMYWHLITISHFNCCTSNYFQDVLFKQAIEVMDKKPILYHHWVIFKKYSILHWESFYTLANIYIID